MNASRFEHETVWGGMNLSLVYASDANPESRRTTICSMLK
jgi:hypothetical protein